MNILMQTRCGCLKGATISASVAPANITVELSDDAMIGLGEKLEAYEKLTRKFTFIGTKGPENTPVYMETLDVLGYIVAQPFSTVENHVEQEEE